MEITKFIIESINYQRPLSFMKYGDGEYMCAIKDYENNQQNTGLIYKGFNYNNYNCDKDLYNVNKKKKLIESFQFMVNNTNNCYIGLWHDDINKSYWQSLVKNEINFVNYHTLFLEDKDNIKDNIDLYKSIKYSKMKKIYICNNLLIKAKILLNIDHMIYISYNNWFETQLNEVIENIKNIISNSDNNDKFIIMTSGGITSKILIYELAKLFPNNIYLDFGSAIDKICTKKTTRGWEPSYEKLIESLQEIIPSDWNNSEYDYIYDEANKKLGIHI